MAQQSARPHIFREDDGCLLIEWVWLERRFGLSLDPGGGAESCWYYVNKAGISEGDYLPAEVIAAIRKQLELDDGTD